MANLVFRRPVQEDDEDFLRLLYHTTRDEINAMPWHEDDKQRFLDQQYAAQRIFYQKHYPDAVHDVITMNGQSIGRIIVDGEGQKVRIVDISLLPEFRGRGIGEFILAQIKEQAEKTGATIHLSVQLNNRAIRLYERLGFRKVGVNGIFLEMAYQAVDSNYLLQLRAIYGELS